MAENKKEYVKKIKDEINTWEKEGPGFLTNVTDFMLWPAMKAADLLIPEAVTQTVSTAIEGCLNGLLWGADYTFSDKDVIAKLTEKNSNLNSLKTISKSDDFETMDSTADHYWNYNLGYAITQGAACGAGGLAGLAANIPALYMIVFRCIQQIALCYGFDTSKDEERLYMIGILSIASASDIKSKQAAMVFMKQIQVGVAKKTWKKLAEESGKAAVGTVVTLVRQAAKSLSINITKRKALQLIPVIGGVIGGSFDGMYLQDIARAAKNCYRKRKLEQLGY